MHKCKTKRNKLETWLLARVAARPSKFDKSQKYNSSIQIVFNYQVVLFSFQEFDMLIS